MIPVVQKPLQEPVIGRDGQVNYSASNNIDPLVSFDMVKEFYDMQAPSLRETFDRVYNSISTINANIEGFQSQVDQTNNSYTLFQRTVNAQLDNIKHVLETGQNQTVLQLTSFSDRIDYIEKQSDQMRNNILEHKQATDDLFSTLKKSLEAMQRETTQISEQFEEQCQMIRNVESMNISNEERINGILNHIIPNLGKEMEQHDHEIIRMLRAESDRAKNAENELLGQAQKARGDIDKFVSDLNDEKIRAQQEELKLIDLITSSGINSAAAIKDLQERAEFNAENIASTVKAIVDETARSTGAEDNLRNMIAAETARATAEENSIKTDVKTITDALSGQLGDANSLLNGLVSKETDERKTADDAIKVEMEDQLNKLHEKIETGIKEASESLTNLLIDEVGSERDTRMAKDAELLLMIQGLSPTIESIGEIDKRLSSEITRSMNSDEHTTKMFRKLWEDIKSDNEKRDNQYRLYFEKIRELTHIVEELKEYSDNMDERIEDKIKIATATILNRIEALDNRLDAEVIRARRAEMHITHRQDRMEGFPVSEEDDTSLPENRRNNPDQELMITDTEKED
jgi:ribosomal protein S4